VATDERDKKFFVDMAIHYDLTYLDDYMHLIENINPNFYGMIDQLVASQGRVFFGCWFSTFTVSNKRHANAIVHSLYQTQYF
jgi:hypothetical protein